MSPSNTTMHHGAPAARRLILAAASAATVGLAACSGGTPDASPQAEQRLLGTDLAQCADALDRVVQAGDAARAVGIDGYRYRVVEDTMGVDLTLLDDQGNTLATIETRAELVAYQPFAMTVTQVYRTASGTPVRSVTEGRQLAVGGLAQDTTLTMGGRTLQLHTVFDADLQIVDAIAATPVSELPDPATLPAQGKQVTIDGVELAALDVADIGAVDLSQAAAWRVDSGLEDAYTDTAWQRYLAALTDTRWSEALNADYAQCRGSAAGNKTVALTGSVAGHKQTTQCAQSTALLSTLIQGLGADPTGNFPSLTPGTHQIVNALLADAKAGGAFAALLVSSPALGVGFAIAVPIFAGIIAEAAAPYILHAALSGNPAAQAFYFPNGPGGTAPAGSETGGDAGGGGGAGGGTTGGSVGGGFAFSNPPAGTGSGSGFAGGGAGGGATDGGGSGGNGGNGGNGSGGGSGDGGNGGGSGGGGSGGSDGGSGGSGTSGPGDSTGDPHLITFDGLRYDFQAAGEFTLVATESQNPLTIQVRQQPLQGGLCSNVAYNTAIATRLDGARVSIDARRDPVLLVDGQPAFLPGGVWTGPTGGQLIETEQRYALVWPDGSSLQAGVGGDYLNLAVRLADEQAVSARGLLGGQDGDPGNDLQLADGTVLPEIVPFGTLYGDFADSWRITQADSLFDYDAGAGTDDFQIEGFPDDLQDVDDLPANAVAMAETACADAGITDASLLADCVLDVACTSDPSFADEHATRRLPAASAIVSEPVFFNGWTVEGRPGNGNWTVSADGTGVEQGFNGDPTFFVSDIDYLGVDISGTLQVGFGDDDHIGFVFGWTSPLAANGDSPDDYAGYLFTWKQFPQSGAEEGFTLMRLDGTITNYGPLFTPQDSAETTVLASLYGSDRGWEDNTLHRFRLTYTADRITIRVDDELVFDLTAADAGVTAFPNGRFGFYNYSQSGVTYADFSSAPVN